MIVKLNILVICLVLTQGLDARVTSRNSRGIMRQCSHFTPDSSPVHLTRLDMEPNPVLLPGDMYFTLEGYTNRTLGSSSLHLDIVREGSWFNIPIPCIMKIGSCSYTDTCTLLDTMVNEDWMGITRDLALDIQRMLRSNGMNIGCPQLPQTVSIIRSRIALPTLPAAMYWFAEGRYRARVRLTDNTNGEELMCIDLTINMRKNNTNRECSGFWGCIFK